MFGIFGWLGFFDLAFLRSQGELGLIWFLHEGNLSLIEQKNENDKIHLPVGDFDGLYGL